MRIVREIFKGVAEACGTDERAASALGDGAATATTLVRVFFGAGTPCFHCSGKGYTYWPSSGEPEQCWYCSGTGIREA